MWLVYNVSIWNCNKRKFYFYFSYFWLKMACIAFVVVSSWKYLSVDIPKVRSWPFITRGHIVIQPFPSEGSLQCFYSSFDSRKGFEHVMWFLQNPKTPSKELLGYATFIISFLTWTQTSLFQTVQWQRSNNRSWNRGDLGLSPSAIQHLNGDTFSLTETV